MSDPLVSVGAKRILDGHDDHPLETVAILLAEIERRGYGDLYTFRLATICGVARDAWEYRDTLIAIPWILLRATPEQHARAFVEVVKERP